MEAFVTRTILDSAKRLDLPVDSALVRDALNVGRLALAEGHDVETASDLGRAVLVRATQPSESSDFVAA